MDFHKRSLKLFWVLRSYDSIDLILSCIGSVSSCVKINGKLSTVFYPSRVLRQGGLISPYIFILCLEYLSKLIHKECDSNNWQAFKVRGDRMEISYLFFADDVVLFGEANLSTLDSLTKILDLFCRKSGH